MKVVRATLCDDVDGKAGVAAVFRADVVGLNVELLDGIERNVHRRSGQKDLIVLRAVEKVVRALCPATVDSESDAEVVLRESRAGHDGDEIVQAAPQGWQFGHLMR